VNKNNKIEEFKGIKYLPEIRRKIPEAQASAMMPESKTNVGIDVNRVTLVKPGM